jgi:ATP-dependent helicase Lhr and Lhr-like helicase
MKNLGTTKSKSAMESAFSRFPARLQAAIVSQVGWSTLRPVQEMASHALLDGNNAVILAPTAGGKTEASMFPVIAQLIDPEPQGVGAIYIAPIKALLNNQADRLGLYTEMVGLRRFLWHGDIKAGSKKSFLNDPAAVLMTTPESLEVMLLSAKVDCQRIFKDLRAIVIDEVHAIAGTDRGAHLMSVIERLAKHTSHDIQRVGLSATVGNPADILVWLQGTSQRPSCVVDPPKVASKKDLRLFLHDNPEAIAVDAGALALGKKSLFFCQSRSLSEDIAKRMVDRGTDVFVHHSSVSLEERSMAEEKFQEGRNTCIVCTSTLELGIDVGDLDNVFQANAPSTVSSFLQRLGRTGRRGGNANTTFFVEDSEILLQAAAIIELARRGWVESVPVNNRAWPVLVHQLLALTLQFQAIEPDLCWEQLSVVPDFKGISRTEFDLLIQHMLENGYLFLTGGKLSMGTKAEKTFGHKNFMELYAVFSSPQLYQVQTTAGYTIGTLEQAFVDRLVPDITSFLLGGRSWIVNVVNNDDRTVQVSGAPVGKKPSWGGFIPELLSFELCQEMAKLLQSNSKLPFLDATGQEALNEYRSTFNKIPCIQWNEDGQATWWTFAGGRINHTLKYGIQGQKDWTVRVDNFKLRIEGDSLGKGTLSRVIDRVLAADYWQAETTQNYLMNNMPNYRFSKFQQVLPDRYAFETIRSYLLDIEGISKLREYGSDYWLSPEFSDQE